MPSEIAVCSCICMFFRPWPALPPRAVMVSAAGSRHPSGNPLLGSAKYPTRLLVRRLQRGPAIRLQISGTSRWLKACVPFRVVAVNLAGSVAHAQDSVVSTTLLDRKAGTLTLFAFDKAQGLSEHTSPYGATVYILDGAASVSMNGKKVKASTGDMVIMTADVPHDVRAERSRFKMLSS